jgi:hypothetical protein
MAGALFPIAYQSLSGTAASVTFSGIAGTYRDLYLVISMPTNSTAGQTRITINSDATANYATTNTQGAGSTPTASSSAVGTLAYAYLSSFNDISTANPSMATINFLDYSLTDRNKTFVSRLSSPAGFAQTLNKWNSTAAITSVTLTAGGTTYVAGTTFSLYGLAA